MPYIDCKKYPLKIKLKIENNKFLCLFSSYPTDDVMFEEIFGREVMLCDNDMNIIWIINPESGCTNTTNGVFEKNYLSNDAFFDIFEKNDKYYAVRGDCFLINMHNGLAEFDHWGKY